MSIELQSPEVGTGAGGGPESSLSAASRSGLLTVRDVAEALREAGVERCVSSIKIDARLGLIAVAVESPLGRLFDPAAVDAYVERLRRRPRVLAAARRRARRGR
jgi:hypothetical protein